MIIHTLALVESLCEVFNYTVTKQLILFLDLTSQPAQYTSTFSAANQPAFEREQSRPEQIVLAKS